KTPPAKERSIASHGEVRAIPSNWLIQSIKDRLFPSPETSDSRCVGFSNQFSKLFAVPIYSVDRPVPGKSTRGQDLLEHLNALDLLSGMIAEPIEKTRQKGRFHLLAHPKPPNLLDRDYPQILY